MNDRAINTAVLNAGRRQLAAPAISLLACRVEDLSAPSYAVAELGAPSHDIDDVSAPSFALEFVQ